MKKLLLIEDHREIREDIVEILELEHYKVFSACNGKSGIEIAENEIPDLILCDINMPGISGFEVFTVLKQSSITDKIPFIFITANSEDKCKGLDIGAEDYIIKPFDDMELLSIIKCRLTKNKLFKETIDQEKIRYVKELEEMLKMISHEVRSPLCTCLGLVELLDASNNNLIDDEKFKKIIEGIKINTTQLGDLTKSLTHYIHNTVLKHKME
jgi:DNA-binding response OmpR family regulator